MCPFAARLVLVPVKDPTERPLRRDAERNRELLLAAASDVFAEQGLDATMHDIAAHAGLGVGTAYRRFANKQEIIEALFEQRLERVAALAEAALRDPDAWHGFTTYLERVLQVQQEDRGLTDIINHPHLGQARADEARNRITPLLDASFSALRIRARCAQTSRPPTSSFLQYALGALIDRTRQTEPPLSPLLHHVPRRHPSRPRTDDQPPRQPPQRRRDPSNHEPEPPAATPRPPLPTPIPRSPTKLRERHSPSDAAVPTVLITGGGARRLARPL